MANIPPITERGPEYDSPANDSVAPSSDDAIILPLSDPTDGSTSGSAEDRDYGSINSDSQTAFQVQEIDYKASLERLRQLAIRVVRLQTILLRRHFAMPEASRSCIERLRGPDKAKAVIHPYNRLFASSIIPAEATWAGLVHGRLEHAVNEVELANRIAEANDEQSRLLEAIQRTNWLDQPFLPDTDPSYARLHNASHEAQLADVLCGYFIDEDDPKANIRFLESNSLKAHQSPSFPHATNLHALFIDSDPIWDMKERLLSEMDPIVRQGIDSQPPLSSMRDEASN